MHDVEEGSITRAQNTQIRERCSLRCETPSCKRPGVAFIDKCIEYIDIDDNNIVRYVGRSPDHSFYARSSAFTQ